MQYPSPEAADLAEVYALNREYLALNRRMGAGVGIAGQLARLETPESAALSKTPFLLFSLREDDEIFWDRLFNSEPDLLDQAADPAWAPLTTAAIALIWHLSKRNPHGARLFTACPPAWCSTLAMSRLVRITHRALRSGLQPQPRLRHCEEFWDLLLCATSNKTEATRRAGRMAALQRMLIRQPAPLEKLPAAAACRLAPLARGVSE